MKSEYFVLLPNDISCFFATFRSHHVQNQKVMTENLSQQNALVLITEPPDLKSQIGEKTVGDVFGFHVSYTRELFLAELNAPAPRMVSVCDRAKVTFC